MGTKRDDLSTQSQDPFRRERGVRTASDQEKQRLPQSAAKNKKTFLRQNPGLSKGCAWQIKNTANCNRLLVSLFTVRVKKIIKTIKINEWKEDFILELTEH